MPAEAIAGSAAGLGVDAAVVFGADGGGGGVEGGAGQVDGPACLGGGDAVAGGCGPQVGEQPGGPVDVVGGDWVAAAAAGGGDRFDQRARLGELTHVSMLLLAWSVRRWL